MLRQLNAARSLICFAGFAVWMLYLVLLRPYLICSYAGCALTLMHYLLFLVWCPGDDRRMHVREGSCWVWVCGCGVWGIVGAWHLGVVQAMDLLCSFLICVHVCGLSCFPLQDHNHWLRWLQLVER